MIASRRLSGRVGSGEYLASSLDLDDAVAACGADEFLDAPAGLVLDPMPYCECAELYGQVGLDGLANVVVDRPGL
jgi:hypothetical protein